MNNWAKKLALLRFSEEWNRKGKGKGYTSKRLCEGDRAQEFRGNAQTELLLPEKRPQGRVPRSPAAPPDIATPPKKKSSKKGRVPRSPEHPPSKRSKKGRVPRSPEHPPSSSEEEWVTIGAGRSLSH